MCGNANDYIMESVTCEFATKDEYYKDIYRVLKDNWNVELPKGITLPNEFLDAILEYKNCELDNNVKEENYQKLFLNGRVEVSIRIDKHIAAVIAALGAILDKNQSFEEKLLLICAEIFVFLVDVVRINKGFNRCVVLEILRLTSENKIMVSEEDIKNSFINRKNSSEPCPFDGVCNIEKTSEECCYNTTEYNTKLDNALKELVRKEVIEYQDGNYFIKPFISLR